MSQITTTTEKISNFQNLKAICALANTLRMGFEKMTSKLKVGDSFTFCLFLLADLMARMSLVVGFPKIQEQRQKLFDFISKLNQKTTFAELHQITNECHVAIDKDYWLYSEKEFGIKKEE